MRELRGPRPQLIGPRKKEIFQRDKYYCGYCGTPTIDEDVWPALDRADPCHAILGWDKNWPAGITHPVVWALTASDDHMQPLCHGIWSLWDSVPSVCVE
jgi:hypothetical protein